MPAALPTLVAAPAFAATAIDGASQPDASLLALCDRWTAASAALDAAEDAEMEVWRAWMASLPQPPDDLFVRPSDLTFGACRPPCLGGVWTPEMCATLEAEIRTDQAKLASHPEWEAVRSRLERGKAILAARAAFDRACTASGPSALKRRHKELADVTWARSEEVEAIEAAIRATQAKTVVGLAVKARLLMGYYSPANCQTWAAEQTAALLRELCALAGLEA